MAFPALNAIVTSDDYTTQSTLRCPGAVRVDVDALNASVLVQLGDGGGGIVWRSEVRQAPSFRSRDVRADAVRVRSAVAGKPAIVTVEAFSPYEVS